MPDSDWSLIETAILALHADVRQRVTQACEDSTTASLSAVASDDVGDTIFAIDKVSEDVVIEHIAALAEQIGPVVLVAEGLEGGGMVLPQGAAASDAKVRVIIDPIDGTRGIMYQKRPAWILTGVAEEHGDDTRLSHCRFAAMTELPLVKQHLADEFYAHLGQGVTARRFNRLTGEVNPLTFMPSPSDTLEQGFATVSRFFPGGHAAAGALYDELITEVVGPLQPGKAMCFEDQYASTGGQLVELLTGKDRLIADLRPLTAPEVSPGQRPLCCHPYDLAGALIAQEAGVVLTTPTGDPLDPPLDVQADVAWIGYANRTLHDRIAPVLYRLLRERAWVS